MERGRPSKFETPEELERLINEYFDSITITYPLYDSVKDGKDENGEDKYKQIPRLNNAEKQVYTTTYYEHPSILSLAEFLGTTRKTLWEYEDKPQFSNTIKMAKERIEHYLEDQLYRKDQVTGIIFNLKNNFGWKDKQEIEHSGETNMNITTMTNEERQRRIEELKKKLSEE